MTLSAEVIALAEELRSVLAAARENNPRELRRIVGDITKDMRDIARRLAAYEPNRTLDSQWVTNRDGYALRKLNDTTARIAADAIRDGMDPRGYFVYLLWGHDPDVPLYVGQSTNLFGRLGSHLNDHDKRDHIIKVGIIRCADGMSMCETETRLIGLYKPPWNVQLVKGNDPERWVERAIGCLPPVDPKILAARYGTE